MSTLHAEISPFCWLDLRSTLAWNSGIRFAAPVKRPSSPGSQMSTVMPTDAAPTAYRYWRNIARVVLRRKARREWRGRIHVQLGIYPFCVDQYAK